MNDTPTPETDAAEVAQNVANQAIPDKDWPWAAIKAAFDFARSLERRLAESQAACAAMREALRGSQHAMTLAKSVVLRASVASCNCMTKTNALHCHSESCRYRQAEEANDAITAKIEHAARALQPTAGVELLARLQRERELADRLGEALRAEFESWGAVIENKGAASPEGVALSRHRIKSALAEWREARK